MSVFLMVNLNALKQDQTVIIIFHIIYQSLTGACELQIGFWDDIWEAKFNVKMHYLIWFDFFKFMGKGIC